MADLAARGVAHPEVYATAPWTVPSHASMFTGLLPRAAGLSQVPSHDAAKAVLEKHESRFLPAVLRRAGYSTAGVSTNPWASQRSGFGQGFDAFSLVDTERKQRAHNSGKRNQLKWIGEVARGRVDDGARNAERELEKCIGSAGGRPFFGFVNLVECHFPYLPPRPYGNVSTIDRVMAARDARRVFGLQSIYRVNAGVLDLADEPLDRARRLYAGSIRYMDDWLARVLERLDAAGILDDTLVIVTADHGENFGEGGLLGHMLSLDQRLIHVPFVAAGPGAEQLDITSLADLPRGLADAIGLAQHPWTDGPPAGIGLAQSDPLGDARDPSVIQKLAEAGVADEEGRSRLTSVLSCAVRGDLKVVRRNEHEEVYDLTADPLELEPLRADETDPSRAAEIRELRAALDHPAMAVVEPAAAPASSPPPEQSEEELRDLEDRMKLLGYM